MRPNQDTTANAQRIQGDVLRRLNGPTKLAMACEMSDDARDVTLAGMLPDLQAPDI